MPKPEAPVARFDFERQIEHGVRVRVLFSSIGAVGHVYPMVPLAQALASAGHEVRWACSPEVCPMIDQAGIQTVPAGMTMVSRQGHRDDLRAEFATLTPDEQTDRMVGWMFGELLAPAMLDDLLPVVRAWRPALLVHDSMDFAGPIAATAVDAVHVTHSYGPLSPEHRIAAISDRVVTLWESVGSEPRPYGGLYDHLYLDIYPPSMQAAGGSQVGRRQLLRPVPYPPSDGTNRSAALFDDRDRPLVYVTFGTEIPDDGPLRLVIGAIRDQDVRVLVTVGSQRDPDAFGPQPRNVVIERFVPQAAVLPHAAAVISHGGSGTVLAALGAGVPQLCLPFLADQPLNARAVSDAGVGIALDVSTLDDKQVADALSRLLTEASFGQRARSVASEIAQMPSPDEVASAIVELATA